MILPLQPDRMIGHLLHVQSFVDLVLDGINLVTKGEQLAKSQLDLHHECHETPQRNAEKLNGSQSKDTFALMADKMLLLTTVIHGCGISQRGSFSTQTFAPSWMHWTKHHLSSSDWLCCSFLFSYRWLSQ